MDADVVIIGGGDAVIADWIDGPLLSRAQAAAEVGAVVAGETEVSR